MSGKLAYRAGLWYNEPRNIVVLGGGCNTPSRIHLIGDVPMNTLPPHAQDDNTPLKRCSSCPKDNQWHPATTEFFHRNKSRVDGLNDLCKVCRKASQHSPEQQAKKREYDKTYRAQPEVREHTNANHRVYESSPQRQAWLKTYRSRSEVRERKRAYHREYSKRYYQKPENKEKKRVAQKRTKSRPEFQETQRLYSKSYGKRPEVRQRIRNYERNRPLTHPERHRRHREQQRALYHTPSGQASYHAYISRPDVYARYITHAANRRARKRAIQGGYTPEQILDKLKAQKYKCYYCSAKFEKKNGRHIYHIDHTFPISRVAGTDIPANDISYIVLACPTCNLSKHDRFPWEWPEGGRLL